MLITESYVDDVDRQGDSVDDIMRIFIFKPVIAEYPNAEFPAVVLFSEIYQVTEPVKRFARQLAGNGYIVAMPSSYHDFTGPEPLTYDSVGTDRGNAWKVKKKLSSYDKDSTRVVDYLSTLPVCNKRIGAAGMCLGGHLAFRCALDPRVSAAVCYFATDMHSSTLGLGGDDSLLRAHEIKGELIMIFGKKDNHVPREGRNLIRKALDDANLCFSWYEVAHAQRRFDFAFAETSDLIQS